MQHGVYSLAVTRMCLSDGGRGIYSTCRRGSSLFVVEGTLSRCNVQNHLSNCGLGICSDMPRVRPRLIEVGNTAVLSLLDEAKK